MRQLHWCLLFFVFLATATPALAQQTYEERRQELLNKQTNTRAEINVLDARIKTYQDRINQTNNRYDEMYKQYENVNRLISLQDSKITSLVE